MVSAGLVTHFNTLLLGFPCGVWDAERVIFHPPSPPRPSASFNPIGMVGRLPQGQRVSHKEMQYPVNNAVLDRNWVSVLTSRDRTMVSVSRGASPHVTPITIQGSFIIRSEFQMQGSLHYADTSRWDSMKGAVAVVNRSLGVTLWP